MVVTKKRFMKKLKKNNQVANGIWFYGLSGSGKTTSSKYLKKNIFKNALILDGDQIRKHISIDLGFRMEDRVKQLQRIVGLCKICVNSKILPICSTVYMNKKAITELKKLKIIAIKIERDFNKIKKAKTYKYKKNVVGIDLHYEKNFNHLVLKNVTKKNLFKDLKNFFL